MQGTYSIKAILQNNFHPQFCQQLLSQIKSPLLQHSYIVTTDEQFISPLHYQNNNKFKNLIQNDYIQQPFNQQSYFSPLELEVNKTKSQRQQNEIPLCGSVFDQLSELNKQEIAGGFINLLKFGRKKIFKDQKTSERGIRNLEIFNHRQQKKNVSLKIALNILNQIEETQVLNFIQLIGKIVNKIQLLKQIQTKLKYNMQEVYIILALTASHASFQPLSDNQSRVLSRLKVNNLTNAFSKVLNHPHDSKLLEKIQAKMTNIIQILQEVQQIIGQYVNRSVCINELKKVYRILSAIQQQNLYYRIIGLLHSLNIRQLDHKIEYLQYIWPKIQTNMPENDFIKDICRNDLIIRKQSNYEEQLKKRGFTRNN